METAANMPDDLTHGEVDGLEAAQKALHRAREERAQAEAMLAKARPELDATSAQLAGVEEAIGQQRMSGAQVIKRSDETRAGLETLRRRLDRTRRERDEITTEDAQLKETLETLTDRRTRIEAGASELRQAIAFAQAELEQLERQVAADCVTEQEVREAAAPLGGRVAALDATYARTAEELTVREAEAADVLKAAGDLQRELSEAEQRFANARLAHRQARSRHQSALLLVEQRRAAEQRAAAALAQAQEPRAPAAAGEQVHERPQRALTAVEAFVPRPS